MLYRWLAAMAAASCCLAGVGCCGVMQCGDDCCSGRGPSMAFQKYDCSCDGVCGECCGGGKPVCGSGCDAAGGGCGGVMDLLCGCTGCGELYWNEWHNDPPAVCEPCDRCGNYIGPGSVGYYRAPYRRHDGFAESKPTTVRPLELADSSEMIR